MPTFLQQLWSDMRTMPRALWVLTGGQFINRFGSFVNPFLALFLSQHQFAPAQVSAVLGSIAAGQIVAPFASGYLTDAIGRRNTILISLIGSASSTIGLYYCPTLAPLMAMAALHGFLANLFGPAANALMTDLVPAEKRVTAFAIFRLALNAGFAAGPSVAGFLYSRAPALIFWGDAATTLVFALLAFLFLPHGLRTITGRVGSAAVAWRSWREAGIDAWANRPFFQLVAAKLLMSVAFVQVFNVLALNTRDRGLTPVEYGGLMGCNGAIIMVFELPLAQWIKRFQYRPVLLVGFAMVGVGCASFAWAETLMSFLLAMSIFTVGEMISLPMSAAYAAALTPAEYRGRYFGFIGLGWGVAALAGSSGVWFYDRIGVAWWIVTGAFGFLASGMLSFRWADRRSQ